MQKIRAKFQVHNVVRLVSPFSHDANQEKTGEHVQMHPVYSGEPGSENYDFSQATPAGSIELTITNPDAFDFFEVGKEILIDFTRAAA